VTQTAHQQAVSRRGYANSAYEAR